MTGESPPVRHHILGFAEPPISCFRCGVIVVSPEAWLTSPCPTGESTESVEALGRQLFAVFFRDAPGDSAGKFRAACEIIQQAQGPETDALARFLATLRIVYAGSRPACGS
jgi:hypothetical protein